MKLTEEEVRIMQFIRRYPDWVNEVNALSDSRMAIRYDLDRVQTSATSDNVFDLAMQIEHYQECIDKVNHCLVRIYQTDNRITMARQIFCFGKETKRKGKSTIYMQRKAFAAALVETFREEIKNDTI